MSKEQNITPINSSILTILFIVFLILKLTGNIDWSWWWVTSPLWLPVALLFAILGIAFIGIIIYSRGIKQEKQKHENSNNIFSVLRGGDDRNGGTSNNNK